MRPVGVQMARERGTDWFIENALPQFNEAALGQLQAMGFGVNACQRALLATGNDNVEEAMNWLFGHMEDAGKVQRIFEWPQVD